MAAIPPPTPPLAVKPPLGLPSGSVRALLAIFLCGTLWYLVLTGRGDAVPPILAEATLLVVAFYFGVRSTAPVTAVARAAASPDAIAREPLYLPRGFIRTTLLLGFFGVIAYTWLGGQPIPQTLILILQILASYLVGYVFSSFLLRRARAGKELGAGVRALRNGISVLSLGIVGLACFAIATSRFDLVPTYLENGLAWTVAFYFGSRLAA